MEKPDPKEFKEEVDSIIEKLLEVRNSKPGKMVDLEESEIVAVCLAARDIFKGQPVLLELEAPLKICGKLQAFWRLDSLSLLHTG